MTGFTKPNARRRLAATRHCHGCAIARAPATRARSDTSGGNNMNISRRHLTGPLPVLGLLAVGLLGANVAQAMTADEEAVAKQLEAFRAAQFAHDAKALD